MIDTPPQGASALRAAEADAPGATGPASGPIASVDAGEPALYSVRGLSVSFGDREVVRGVDLDLRPGRCLALVGESGSGKSVTARALMGLAGDGASVTASRLDLDGDDLKQASERRWRAVRGAEVGLVLQDALVSLDPLRTIGREVGDAVRLHERSAYPSARARAGRAVELLERVGLDDPAERARQRSGELSGGQRQRALIAAAIGASPRVLIADEPTTALDRTVQRRIVELLSRLRDDGAALLLISHDLPLVAQIADEVCVMANGEIVEHGPTAAVLERPQHEITRALVAAVPTRRSEGATPAPAPNGVHPEAPAISVHEATRVFHRRGLADLVAVDAVSLDVRPGETLGLVGSSGSGKTTLARMIMALETPASGEVRLFGEPWSSLREAERRPRRARIGMVYQDALSSFDPRARVGGILADAASHGRVASWRRAVRDPELRRRVEDGLAAVHLPRDVVAKRPLHLSGGQRQRVAIARALATDPEVLVCDEPVSALDVTVQAEVLALLAELQRERRLTQVFISHDLEVIGQVADRIAVMHAGRIVELGARDDVLDRPQHEVTRRLLGVA